VIARGSIRQQPEELFEVGKRERVLLAHFDVRKIVIPNSLAELVFALALGEEKQIRLYAELATSRVCDELAPLALDPATARVRGRLSKHRLTTPTP
jgi:hypothetical protein